MLDFPNLTILGFIGSNTLMHHIFHQSTDGKAFLMSNSLYLVGEFNRADKGEVFPRSIGCFTSCLSCAFLILRSVLIRFLILVLRSDDGTAQDITEQRVHVFLCHNRYELRDKISSVGAR